MDSSLETLEVVLEVAYEDLDEDRARDGACPVVVSVHTVVVVALRKVNLSC